ncbi:MAG: hypothetical protein K9J17_02300 [Flavobacteriales bacterium]|nr:hypothetical protein [Flavobacteriales bacterium]
MVEIDPQTRAPKEAMPFDQEFYLKIPKEKGLTLTRASIKRMGKAWWLGKTQVAKIFSRAEKDRINKTYGGGPKAIHVTNDMNDSIGEPVLYVYTDDKNGQPTGNIIDSTNYVLLKVFPLMANRKYVVNYEFEASSSEVEHEVDKIIRRPAVSNHRTEKNQRYLKGLFGGTKEILELDSNKCAPLAMENRDLEAQKILEFARNGKLKEALAKLACFERIDPEVTKRKYLIRQFNDLNVMYTNINTTGSLDNSLESFLKCYGTTVFPKLIELCDGCGSKQSHMQILKLDSSYILPSAVTYKSWIASGQLPIDFKNLTDTVEKVDVSNRKKNLEHTITIVERITLGSYGPSSVLCENSVVLLRSLYDHLKNTNSYLEKRAKLLNDITNYKLKNTYALVNHRLKVLHDSKDTSDKEKRKIKQRLKNIETIESRLVGTREYFTKPMNKFIATSIQGTSEGATTVNTKGKFNVRPDFGVAYARNVLNGSGAFNSVVPFFGLRFNLRPLDPNLAFRHIQFKTFWHRSSVNVSYSPITISDGKTRFDIYKNMNFLVGYGFRFSNVVNLSVGAMFYRRDNPEPFNSNKQLTAMPYVGLSIDFDLLDAAKDLISIFK